MAGREPSASPLPLPPAYGKPTRPMAWSDADDLLTESRVYWIASVRPDGRPHIVPSDGIWLDDALYFGGSPDTVHMRNVRATGRAVVHVGDGLAPARIDEGNRTAARTNRVHIDHRHQHGEARDPGVARGGLAEAAVGYDADIARGAADIEGDEVAPARQAARPVAADHARCRA